jgi:SM-20-related protein
MNAITAITPAWFNASDVQIYDNALAEALQGDVVAHLNEPGWAFGAYSDASPNASRYWYKHFAGYVRDGKEARTAQGVEDELETASSVISAVWRQLKSGPLAGHSLTRCYANGYPAGSEGGLHLDSNVPDHFTAIYYPHTSWHPNFAGETVFFAGDGSDIVLSVYPKPNRLVVFPGVIPHVARGVSRMCPQLRVTLMFKTAKSSFPTAR